MFEAVTRVARAIAHLRHGASLAMFETGLRMTDARRIKSMTQYEQLREAARRLQNLARATSNRKLRIRYLEQSLMLAQTAEDVGPSSQGSSDYSEMMATVSG
jgi:hypothetical protein